MRRRAVLAGLAGLSACAPMSQRALTPPGGFGGPGLDADALVSFDGARLPMNTWLAEGEPWAVIIALHGMNDYAQAFTLLGPEWAKAGVTTYAYDQRGFGRSGERGVWGGEALMAQDLRTACALARARHPNAVLAVVGESMGGAVAITAFASANPPDADRLCLLSPAVWGWAEQPIPYKVSLWLGAHLVPGRTLTPPSWLVRRIKATDNIEALRQISRDRRMLFTTRIDAVYGLVGLMQDADAEIGALRLPTLYQYGAHDQVIPAHAAFHAAARLGSNGRTAYYAEGYHMLSRDLQHARIAADVLAFVRDPKAALPSAEPPIPRRAGPKPSSDGVAEAAARR